MDAKFRAPVGIFEAAILLVLAGMALWILRPLPGARTSAVEEKAMMALLGAVADAEDAQAAGRKAAPFLRLDRLEAASPAAAKALQGYSPSKVPGVLGNRSYWLAVLLPKKEGWLAPPGAEEAGEAARGYCVVAWPRKEAPAVLRAMAALPEGFMWQRADGVEESGEPAVPPVPRAMLPPTGQGPRVPPPPPDWAQARRRR
jgi:hypothetical protein